MTMGPYTASAVDMLDFFERQREWSYETFGPREFRGPDGPLDHLKKEVVEALSETDPERKRVEMVDCLFLCLDALHRSGMSYADISRYAMEKLRKNMARTWPDWRTADPNKAVEHDRTKDGVA